MHADYNLNMKCHALTGSFEKCATATTQQQQKQHNNTPTSFTPWGQLRRCHSVHEAQPEPEPASSLCSWIRTKEGQKRQETGINMDATYPAMGRSKV